MTGGASTIVELKHLERRRRKFSEIQAPKHHFLVENSLKTLPKHCQNPKKHGKYWKFRLRRMFNNNFSPPCFRSEINKGGKVIKGGGESYNKLY